MSRESRGDNFIKNPFYKGGHQAMSKFISENLNYPKSVLDGQISGEVYLKYSVDYKGNVYDVRVVAGLDEACNAEAIRVVMLLKFIVPKNPKKLKITFHKNITIHFRFKQTEQTKQPIIIDGNSHSPQTFQYKLITTEKKIASEKPQPLGTTYSYSIKITNTRSS